MARTCLSPLPASLAAVFLASSAVPARAQSTVRAGSEFRVNDYTIGPQQLPSAVMGVGGTSLVVWESEFQDGDSLGVYGRFFDRAGAPLGPEFRVNEVTAGAQTRPSATVDGAGRFTVVWASPDASGSGIFARQFSAAGPLGPEFQLNAYTTGDQSVPRVSAGPGGFAAVWQSAGQDGSGAGVFGRLFTSTGTPRTADFRLSETVSGDQTAPVATALDNGRYAVAWLQLATGGPSVYSRLFDSAGGPLRPETVVSPPAIFMRRDHVSIAAASFGTYAVGFWEATVISGKFGFLSYDHGMFVRYHDANGEPTTLESAGGAGEGTVARWQGAQGMTYLGRALMAYASTPGALMCFHIPPDPTYCPNVAPEDGSGAGVFAKPMGWPGAPPRIQVNTFTAGHQNVPSVAADGRGNMLVAWQSMAQDGSDVGIFAQRLGGFFPGPASVDAAGDGVLDPGQPQEVRPSWLNLNGAAQPLSGSLYGFSGPPGATYSIVDGTAIYGTVPNGSTGACTDCYILTVTVGGRPALHMDSYAGETLNADVHTPWALHVGGSFTDVSSSSPFYRFIETLLHTGVTSGCGGTGYCPGSATSRDQMAAFVLAAKQGPGYAPPACGAPMFPDVPASSPFCPWVEELARRGVVGGCGGGNYCPGSAVTREQMAVFVLRTLDPLLVPPACTAPLFADVPASSPFCRWIEELARRGVAAGCGGGNYCPAAAVTREQMAVFLTATFSLRLY